MDILLEILRLLVAIVIAFLMGKLISKLKLPAILGWLIAGMLIGPHALNLLGSPILESGWFSAAESLFECVLRGREKEARRLAEQETAHTPPMQVVENILVPALQKAGEGYAQGTLYLPQLLACAEAAKAAFAVVGEKLGGGGVSRGKVVLATVRGDVHDIGKNIVKVVAQSYGFEVVDLGKDTPKEKIVEATLRIKPLAVGLSALMTTTVVSMEETIRALREAGCTAKIFVGGAVLTEEIAREIGADIYTANALEFVRTLERLSE